MAQSAVSSVPTTPLSLGGSIASHMAEIEYLESELADKQQVIKYAESRIRQLKAIIYFSYDRLNVVVVIFFVKSSSSLIFDFSRV